MCIKVSNAQKTVHRAQKIVQGSWSQLAYNIKCT